MSEGRSGLVVGCLPRDWGDVSSSFTVVTALCSWAIHMLSFLVQVQPRKTHHDITENLLTQTFRVKLNKQITKRCLFIKYVQKKNVVSHLLQKNWRRLMPVTQSSLTSNIRKMKIWGFQFSLRMTCLNWLKNHVRLGLELAIDPPPGGILYTMIF